MVDLWFQHDSEDTMCFLQLLGIPPFEPSCGTVANPV